MFPSLSSFCQKMLSRHPGHVSAAQEGTKQMGTATLNRSNDVTIQNLHSRDTPALTVHPNKQTVLADLRTESKDNASQMKQASGCQIFLLSPAYAGGERARMILRDQAQFELARKLRGKSGAPIADVFTFLSGLYFRGKVAYANAFARPISGTSGVFVITPTRGLIDARTRIHLDDLREFAEVNIHQDDPRYRIPIERDARKLATKLPVQSEVILLGSIATGKYVDVLLANFREQLRFPADFVGRGDMSCGGLMLRCAADLQELSYIPVAGAIVNGKRPPKLAPRRYAT